MECTSEFPDVRDASQAEGTIWDISGTLYGLYDARLPHPNLIEGIGLRTVSTKVPDGPQHPGADALEVATLLTDASGGDTPPGI